MKEEMKGLSEELTAVVHQEVEALRHALQQEMVAGAAPAAAQVTELEKRLAEAEARLAEAEERLRLDRAGPRLPAAAEPDFRGAFVSDVGELRRRLREHRVGDAGTRAIDSSLFTSGGKLSAETADRFLDFLVAEQPALSRVQLRRMGSPEGHTDELTVQSRRLRRGSEGQAPTVADGIGTKRRLLSTVEVIWAEDITLTFLEDNIEKQEAESAIARLLATAFGNDLDDLAWNGDEGESDPFLSINDGWLAIAAEDPEANELDLSDSVFAEASAREVLGAALRQMPQRFKGRTDQAFFVPVALAERYAEETADRQTGLGDQVLVGGFPALRYFGIPVVPEPHLTGDSFLLSPTGNLFFGVQRQMTVDGQWQPRRRVVEYTLTARVDFEYATGKALVVASGLPEHLQ